MPNTIDYHSEVNYKEEKPKTRFIFEVPNDETGQFFIHLMNKYRNKGTYTFRKKGRGPRAEAAKKDGLSPRAYDSFLPIKHATYFQLYLDPAQDMINERDKLNGEIWHLKAIVKKLLTKLSKFDRIQRIVEE